MTAKERADDILRRCWNNEKYDPPPEFKGLDVEIENAVLEAQNVMKERCAAKIEEQKGLLISLFSDGRERYEAICDDLARSLRNLK